MSTTSLESRLTSLAPASAPVDSARLDAAHAAVLAAIADDRVDAPGDDALVVPLASVRRRRRTRRALLAVAACLVLGVAVVVGAPHGADAPAFASWTSSPEPIDTTGAADEIAQCRSQSDELQNGPAAPVLLERRGEWVYGLFAWTSGTDAVIAQCLVRSPHSGDLGYEGGVASASGRREHPAPDELVWATTASDATWVAVAGYAGDEVVRAVLSVERPGREARTVVASVAGGWFGAWWPRDPGGSRFSVTWYLQDGTVGGTLENMR